MTMKPMKRRDALKLAGGAGLAAAVPMMGTKTASAGLAGKRPNVVLIMADDMGYSDLGCYGSEIDTPTLDHMGMNGVRFRHFYNAARCCPTRASLLTGLYPHQAGVGHMIRDKGSPAYQGYLNQQCVTLGEALGSAGYQTAISGKWHVGEKRPHWPIDRGFDEAYGLISGASNLWKIDHGRVYARNATPITQLPRNGYMTDLFTDNAVAYVNQFTQNDDPFFLYVPYTAPHWPLHAHPDDIEKYRGGYRAGWDKLREERYARMLEMGVIDESWAMSPREDVNSSWDDAEHKDWQDARMATYAAMIDRMDWGIGQILQAVRDAGQEENTLFLFLCDNGGCHEGRPGNDPEIMPGSIDTFQSYGRAWAQASNTPFRKYKHWVHEGGSSTPLIAYWKGHLEPGMTDEVGHVIDLMPTFLELANAEYPERFGGHDITPVEGKSLVPTLEGRERSGHEALFWEHCGNCAMRQGDMKLVRAHGTPWELYDLKQDRSELNNLVHDRADVAADMQGAWQAWADSIGVRPWDEVRRA